MAAGKLYSWAKTYVIRTVHRKIVNLKNTILTQRGNAFDYYLNIGSLSNTRVN